MNMNGTVLLLEDGGIHKGQCEECMQRQGVIFCNLFISRNVKLECVNLIMQLYENFKNLNYMSV
jgi:hypothetical protein